jgi:hypothetical protein
MGCQGITTNKPNTPILAPPGGMIDAEESADEVFLRRLGRPADVEVLEASSGDTPLILTFILSAMKSNAAP